MSTKRKCQACKGTGEQLAPPSYPPKHMSDVPSYKCTECDGTGDEQHFQMIFWSYDSFPYVLASRGFLRDDGLAYCPSYNACFTPIRVMTLERGQAVADELKNLSASRSLAIKEVDMTFMKMLQDIAPWAKAQ